MTKFNFVIIGFFILVVNSQAQRTIIGHIKDGESGDGLIGANVVAKEDETIGTITDIDGNFSLSVPGNVTILVISYTGYENREENILNTTVINTELMPGQLLQDVVIIGYGTIKREDATGSIQTVSSDRFNKGAVTSPQDLIAGKIAGVVVTSGDGSPGGGAKIRIRGESSLSASNDPLVVIDGIPIDNKGISGSRNALNLVNPNDIETFTVLKDASATAIYGSRASAGVILITTKKSKSGDKLHIGYTANFSVGNIINKVDMLTADQYREAVHKYKPADTLLLGNESTDWQDLIYQEAVGHDHNLSLSGSLKDLPYRLSLGYTDKNGVLKTDNFNRIGASLNLNPGFIDNRLQINAGLKIARSKNVFANRGAIGNALNMDPTQSPYDTSSVFGGYFTWLTAGAPNALAPTNPIAQLELAQDKSTVDQYIANASIDYRFKKISALRANLNLGYDYSNGNGSYVVPTTASFAFDLITGGGTNNVYEQTKKNSVLEYYMNYKKDFGVHGLDVTGGYSWQHFFVDNYALNSDAAGTPSETTEFKNPREYYLASLFGRAIYDYDDRIFFTGTLRRDGTSRFDPKYRWGLFPSTALAIKLIDNDKSTLNNLKLRVGWGVTGQQDIGDDYYAYLARYQSGLPGSLYQFGNEYVVTLRPNGYVADIKWEETATLNAGLDFSIVKDKVSGSIDVYKRNTKDLLNYIQLPALSNLTNFVTDNIGTMETKGMELSLNLTPIKEWSIGFNAAYTLSQITKLTTNDDPDYAGLLVGEISGGVGSNIQIHSVGNSPNSFFVYKQVYDETGKMLEGVFEDLNEDGVVNTKDQYRYNAPAPRYTFGITSSTNISNFDLSFGARANFGQYVYNNIKTDMGYTDRIQYGNALWNIHQSAIDLDTKEQAKLTFSDHFVTPADFVKVDHITLGYSFYKVVGESLKLSATVQNPFTFTDYDGLDPELGSGIDNNIYPRPRTFVFGLSVNF